MCQGIASSLAPPEATAQMAGVHILRIQDGKIVELWGTNDDLGLMCRLGVLPSLVTTT